MDHLYVITSVVFLTIFIKNRITNDYDMKCDVIEMSNIQYIHLCTVIPAVAEVVFF